MYAVGDIHGRCDLFEQLLALLEADHRSRRPLEAEIILLGDYIDRGRDSRRVLDRLLQGPPPWASWTLLRGNHEQIVLDILDEPMREVRDALIQNWVRFGGREMMLSYGADEVTASGQDPWASAAFLAANFPPAHRALLASTGFYALRDGFFFAHAGIRPGLPLEEQTARDFLWIRDEFLDSKLDHGLVVVHGHTITSVPEVRPNRIGIDTGAYKSGVLTALAIEGTEMRLIDTSASADFTRPAMLG